MTLTNEQEQWLNDFFAVIDTDRVNEWGRTFITDMEARYQEWGSKLNISPKQWAKLHEYMGYHSAGYKKQ